MKVLLDLSSDNLNKNFDNLNEDKYSEVQLNAFTAHQKILQPLCTQLPTFTVCHRMEETVPLGDISEV